MYSTIKKGLPFLAISASCGLVFTSLTVIILSGVLLQQEIPLQILKIILTITTIFSGIFSGVVIGKKMKEKKFIWGLVAGFLYFFLILLMKLFFGATTNVTATSILPLFFCCIGGGVLGGMLG